jgi:hypothetical protein
MAGQKRMIDGSKKRPRIQRPFRSCLSQFCLCSSIPMTHSKLSRLFLALCSSYDGLGILTRPRGSAKIRCNTKPSKC